MARKSAVESSEVRTWLGAIKNAETERDQADNKYGYSASLSQYRGDFSVLPSFVSNVDVIPINEVYAYAKAFVPSVYAREPYIAINPHGARSIAGAKMLELALRAYWRELRLKKEGRRVIWDGVFAEGWMKVGYTGVFGEQKPPDDKPALDPSEFVSHEEIFAKRISWKNMARDCRAVDGLHDCRWVAQNVIVPLKAAQESSLYENTKDLKATYVDKSGLKGEDYEEEYASIWEIWDRDSYKVFALAEGAPDWLWKPKPWPYDMEGFPYVLLRFNENPDEAYAPNLIQPWIAQLWEKMKIRAMQMDHIKRYNRQMQAARGAFTAAEKAKFTKGLTGSIIEHDPKFPDGMKTIPYPPFQQDAYATEGRIDLDKDNVSGQPNAVRSAPQRTQSRTLGEIDRLVGAFQARQIDPQSQVEEFLEEVGYKLIKVMQEHLPGEKFVRATAKDAEEVISAFGKEIFDGSGFRMSRDQIRGVEFDLDLKAGSTLPLDKQGRTEAVTSFLKLGPTIGIQPGDEVSVVAGKVLLGELELKELELAFDRKLARMSAMEKMSKAAAIAANQLTQDKVHAMQERLSREQAAGMEPPMPPGGGNGM